MKMIDLLNSIPDGQPVTVRREIAYSGSAKRIAEILSHGYLTEEAPMRLVAGCAISQTELLIDGISDEERKQR